MVKVYYTYSQPTPFGMAISKTSNFTINPTSNHLICGVNQYITIISLKTGDVLRMLHKEGKNVNVRYVYYCDGRVYGGYQDGEIVVWAYQSAEIVAVFDMHKVTVSWIVVEETKTKMISASMDGSIIVWDLLSQQHHQIKSAHPAPITQIHPATVLIKNRPTACLMSIGKDGFLRLWNLQNYLCIDAISCQVTQAYSLYYDEGRNIIFVATNKEDIVVVQINGDTHQQGKVLAVKGVLKKKSFARAIQVLAENGLLYVVNSDKTIQIYKMLMGKDLEARKKRLQSRKKKQPQQPQQIQEAQQQPLAYLKHIQQKTVPYKFYNVCIHNGQIYLNNGTNIYNLSSQSQVTVAMGRTEQLSLEYPYLLQRSTGALNLYTSNTFNKLYTIDVKATWACLFGKGYVLVVSDHLAVWEIRGNREVCRLDDKWTGASVRGNKGLLWRENQLGMFQVGYDKHKNIKIKISQTRKFQDKITESCYKHNPQKYIICLQNSQVLINHSDSHKPFLKLYGHKLPITSYSLSSDDSILATGSLDKDIKLWDLQFGNTIKTIFAHQQGITIVRFIEETHYLLSGSKDGHVRFWDMDTWELIMDFQQSLMEVRGLVTSTAGDVLVVGGLDEGFRVWRQSGDQTIAADMVDRNMEKMMIEDYTKQKLETSQQKTRYQDLKHGEQIIQALQQKCPPKKLVTLLKQIPAGNLKSSLSFLHQRHIFRLQEYMHFIMETNYELETCWRVIKEIGRGTPLAKQMRERWMPVEKIVAKNMEVLAILRTEVRQLAQDL